MLRYLIRRTFWAIWLFFAATFITYVIFFLIPNDPGRLHAFGFTASPVQASKIQSELHLDVPFLQQYWIFVWNIIRHGSLGYSFQNGASVRWILAQDARVTASLVFGGLLFWLVISIPVGILSALRPRSVFDRFAMVFVLFGISAPPIWLGLILAYIFGFKLGWTPIADYCNFFSGAGGECSGPGHWAYHLILPWTTFTFLFAAIYVRMIRAGVMEAASEDFVRTARAKGAPERRVVVKHILRNSMLPIVTMLGMDIAIALGGALFIERVFNLHGLGVELLEAAHAGDVPIVVGVVVFVTSAVIIANFIVDVVYAWLDPRIRLR
ncbi:MAG TPA: ABC transporter permease [Gaiellaceae bacterium]|nr:ABC transporter permease [Gaiellaceae bacterium]